jgi:hypothetical protein
MSGCIFLMSGPKHRRNEKKRGTEMFALNWRPRRILKYIISTWCFCSLAHRSPTRTGLTRVPERTSKK